MTRRRRLKITEVGPARDILMKRQGSVCWMCDEKLGGKIGKQPVLDHCHVTGYVRDILCRNCNGMEGKVFNLARRAKQRGTEVQWLRKLLEYYERHSTPQHGGVLHPTHKTENEKRLARNKKARERRQALKKRK